MGLRENGEVDGAAGKKSEGGSATGGEKTVGCKREKGGGKKGAGDKNSKRYGLQYGVLW